MKNKLYIFILSVVLFASCKGKEETFDQGYDYYPIAKGNYKIYDVRFEDYSTSGTVTEDYQIKEIVTDTFTLNGELKYRIERFKRAISSDPWPETPDSVWTSVVFSSRIIKAENNVRFVKLTFPVENGKSWNGNAENDFGDDQYVLNSVGKSFTVNGQLYSKTATVLQSPNDSNFVNKDYRKEVYAKGIGMIYKVKEIYEYEQGANWGLYKIESGIKYYERLNSYGSQ
jgi:hypothetical protein